VKEMKIMVRNEKMKRISFMCVLMLALFLIEANLGYGYSIDGLLNDWGINLSAATNIGYLDTHLPSGGLDIDYTTEDNTASNIYSSFVDPGYSYRNLFDAEAIYFDNDQNNAYIAIVQGLPIEGYKTLGTTYLPGDIAIDIGSDGSYEYGIDIDTGILYNVTSWDDAGISSSSPWRINTGTNPISVPFVYSSDQNNHYVLEASIPLSDLVGLATDPFLSIHWTQQCGNDYLTLPADVNSVPEPSTLLLLGFGLICVGFYGWRRKKK
jgi:hypothetical protein